MLKRFFLKFYFVSVLVALASSATGMALAADFQIKGNVYAGYSASNLKKDAPLGGMIVELLNANDNVIDTVSSKVDGSYSLKAPSAGLYRVKVSSPNKSAPNDQGDKAIALSSNIFLKPQEQVSVGNDLIYYGSGGKIILYTYIEDNAGPLLDKISSDSDKMYGYSAKGIEAKFSLNNDKYKITMAELSAASNSQGFIEINNVIKGMTYKGVVSNSGVPASLNNYVLWRTSQFNDEMDFLTFGTTASAYLLLHEKSPAGIDLIVANDQNANGVYNYGVDTPAYGARVRLYYQGTTRPIAGLPEYIIGVSNSDITNASISIRNLPEGKYTVGIAADEPWKVVARDNVDFEIVKTTAIAPKSTILLVVDEKSKVKLPGASGYVYLLAIGQLPTATPDSGQVAANMPSGSTLFNSWMDLYIYNNNQWEKLSELNSGQYTGKRYRFSGLLADRDYKIVQRTTPNTNAYIFVNDSDGKSAYRDVELSTGDKETIAGREIVLPKLGNQELAQQNFWYSYIANGPIRLIPWIRTTFDQRTWGGTIHGGATSTTTAYAIATLYEEDGKTRATNSKGELVPPAVYLSPATPYSPPGLQNIYANYAGFYWVEVEFPSLNESRSLHYAKASTQRDLNFDIYPENSNKISGHIYINNSAPDDQYIEGVDTPLPSGRIVLRHKLPDGKYRHIATMYTGDTSTKYEKGYYEITNLPNGTYLVEHTPVFGVTRDVEVNDIVQLGSSAKNSVSKIEITVTGGQHIENQNFWYRSLLTSYTIRGKAYLDSFGANNTLQVGQPNNNNDLPLFGTKVYLCVNVNGMTDAQCINKAIASRTVGITGEYLFDSAKISGIVPSKQYRVVARRDATQPITNSSTKPALAPSYVIDIIKDDFLPHTRNFLFKTSVRSGYSGTGVIDFNGNVALDGGVGSLERLAIANPIYLEYLDSSNNWVRWANIRQYWNDWSVFYLPPGRYRHVMTPVLDELFVGNYNSTTPTNIAEFTVNSNETYLFKGGLDGDVNAPNGSNRHVFGGRNNNTPEAINGKIYLQVGGINREPTQQELKLIAPNGLTVKGYALARFYKHIRTKNTSDQLREPDFVDNKVADTGRYAYTARNSKINGRVYMGTHMLLLEGLRSGVSVVSNNGADKSELDPAKVILPNDFVTNPAYLLSKGTVYGVVDQHYYVKIDNLSVISGRLFYDYNKNNIYDKQNGDVPMADVTVNLLHYNNGKYEIYGTIRTDNDGFYQFDGMPPGKYIVEAPKTYEDIIAPLVGTVNGLSPEYQLILPSSGRTGVIEIFPKNEELYTDNNFYYTNTEFSNITGGVALDIDNDGLFAVDKNGYQDLAMKDIWVYLYRTGSASEAVGTPYMKVQTDSEGLFKFTDIPDQDQDFTIKVILEPNYGVISSYNPATPNPSLNVSDTLKVHVTVKDNLEDNYFLLAGRTNTHPAGGIKNTAALTSGVFGVIKNNDTGLGVVGLRIGLYDMANLTGGRPTLVVQQRTNSKGEYHFHNLDNGSYQVVIMQLPEDTLVIDNAQHNRNSYLNITLADSGLADQYFTLQEVSKGIQGFVYVDFANDTTSPPPKILQDDDKAINDITIELYAGFDATGELLESVKSGESTTGEILPKGKYKFGGIDSGKDYSVKITIPNLYRFKTSTGKAVAGATTEAYQYIINVASLPQDGVDDADFFMIGAMELKGDVWLNDVDVNGWNLTKDDDEEVNGAAVQLYYLPPDATDEIYVLLKNTVTNIASDNKGYRFSNIAPGDYRVLVPDGSSKPNETSTAPGASEPLKYAVLISGLSDNVNPIQIYDLSTSKTDLSTGYQYKGLIAGTVIIDVDNNNAFHATVDGRFEFLDLIASATVKGTVISRHIQTQAGTGNFTFNNLPPSDPGTSWKLDVASPENQTVVADLEHYRLAFSKLGSKTTIEPTLPMEVGQGSMIVSGIVVGYTGLATLEGCLVYDYQLGAKTIDSSKDIPLNDINVYLLSSNESFSTMPPLANNGFKARLAVTGDNSNGLPGCFTFENVSGANYRVYIDPTQAALKGYRVSFNPVQNLESSDDDREVQDYFDVKPVGAKDELVEHIDFGYKGERQLEGYVTRDVDNSQNLTSRIDENGDLVVIDPPFSTPVTLVLIRTEPALPDGVTVAQPEFTLNTDMTDGAYIFDNIGPGKWSLQIQSTIPSEYDESYRPASDEYLFNPTSNNSDENRTDITDVNYGYLGRGVFNSTIAYDHDPEDGLSFVDGVDELITGRDDIAVQLIGPEGFIERTTTVDPLTGTFSFSQLDEAYAEYQVHITTDTDIQPTFPMGWRPSYSPYQTNTSDEEFINKLTIDWQKESSTAEKDRYFAFRNDGRISGRVFRDMNPDDSETLNATGMASGDALFPLSYDLKVTVISEDGLKRIVKPVNEDGTFVINNLGQAGVWYVYIDDGNNSDIDSATADTVPAGHEFSYAVIGAGGVSQQLDGQRIKVEISFDGNAESVTNKEVSGLNFALKGQGTVTGQVVVDTVFDADNPMVDPAQDLAFENVLVTLYEKDELTNEVKNQRYVRSDSQGHYTFEYVNFNSDEKLNWFIDIDFADESGSPTNQALLAGYELSFKPKDDFTCETASTCNIENGVTITDSDRETEGYTATKLKLTAVTDVSHKYFGLRGTQTVSGIVFRDMNPDDGAMIFDYDHHFEPADQIYVSLMRVSNPDAILTTLVTYDDIQGGFTFDHVAEGDWLVYVSEPAIDPSYPDHVPENHTFSFALLNYDATQSGNNATVVREKRVPVSVNKQENFANIALGYKGIGEITGLVGVDIAPDLMNLKMNLSQDKPLAGITVTLFDDSRAEDGIALLSRTAVTDENGAYQFTDVTYNPNWRIMVNPTNIPSTNPNLSLLDGYQVSFRPKDVGLGGIYDEDEDGNAIFDSALAIMNATSLSNAITDKNFAFKGNAALSGKVTRDIDVSHDFTEGVDMPFPSERIVVTLTLEGTSFDGSPIIRAMQTSNEYDGTYTVPNVSLGQWSIAVDETSIPALYNNEELSYFPEPVDIDVDTESVDALDIGIKGAITYSGYLVYDTNPLDGYHYNDMVDEKIIPTVDNIYVTLTAENENFNTKYNVFKLKDATDPLAPGLYEITDLDPNYGEYIVAIDTGSSNSFPAGWIPSFVPYEQPAVGGSEVNIDWSKSYTDNNFGFQTSGSISGYVLRDMDPNEDENTSAEAIARDLPISGVKVTLINRNNPADIRTTLTGDGQNNTTDGFYIFEGILPGDWEVVLDSDFLPTGTLPNNHDVNYITPAESKTAGTVVSHVTTNKTVAITITQINTQAINANFGLKGNGTISGTIVIDVDPGKTAADAAIDTGSALDYRVENVTVFLTNELDEEPVVRKAVTDAQGYYTFTDVTYGQWVIAVEAGLNSDNETILKGYDVNFRPKDDATGTGSDTDGVIEESSGAKASLKLTTADVVVVGKDFGFKSRTTLVGHVTRDIDLSGNFTNVDLSFADEQTLVLTKIDSVPPIVRTITTSTVTDERGSYIIDGVLPGKWELSVITPANYTLSYLPEIHSTDSAKLTFDIVLEDVGYTDLDFGFKGQGIFSGFLVKDINVDDGAAFVSGVDEIIIPPANDQPIYVQLSSWQDNSTDFTTHKVQLDSTTGEYLIEGLDPEYDGYLISVISNDANNLGFPSGWEMPSFNPYGSNTSKIKLDWSRGIVTTHNYFGFRNDSGIVGSLYRDMNPDDGTDGIHNDQLFADVKVCARNTATSEEVCGISDDTGDFTLVGLSTGTWALQLDDAVLTAIKHQHSYSILPQGNQYVTSNGDKITVVIDPINNKFIIGDIGFGVQGKAMISGLVSIDIDPQASITAITPNDIVLENIIVALSNGSISRYALTDSHGLYMFNGVTFDDNWTVTVDPALSINGLGDNKPSLGGYLVWYRPIDDISGNGSTSNPGRLAAGSDDNQFSVPLTETQWFANSTIANVEGRDFGFTGAGIISGLVFRDMDASDGTDSVKEYDRFFEDPVQVTLVNVNDSNIVYHTSSSSVDGSFRFDYIAPGQWQVFIDDSETPVNHLFSYALDDQGNTAGQTIAVNLTEDISDISGLSFGFKGTRTISGHVVIDMVTDLDPTMDSINDVGIGDIQVVLFDDSDPENILQLTAVTSVDNSNKGEFTFNDISYNPSWKIKVDSTVLPNSDTARLGKYRIYFRPADNDIVNAPGTVSADYLDFTAKLPIYVNSITSIEARDFGFIGTGSIRGQIFRDMNVDDSQTLHDYDQYFNSPVTVTLVNLDRPTVKYTTKTNPLSSNEAERGQFIFNDIANGRWGVYVSESAMGSSYGEHVPANHQFSYALKNSNQLVNYKVLEVIIDDDTPIVDGLAIGFKGLGTIKGQLVIDIDPDSGAESDPLLDIGLGGIELTLKDAKGNVVLTTQTQDGSNGSVLGEYAFNNVTYNDWTLSIDETSAVNAAKLKGYVISFRASDDTTGNGSPLPTHFRPSKDDKPFTSIVQISELGLKAYVDGTAKEKNFGLKGRGVINGYVLRALSGDQPSAADDGLGSITVQVTNGALVREALTSVDGSYTIDGLNTGKWIVTIDETTLPLHHQFSYVNVTGEGATDTPVVNGVEIDINQTLARNRSAVSGSQVDFGIKASASVQGQVVIDIDDTIPNPPDIDPNDISVTDIDSQYLVRLYVKKSAEPIRTVTPSATDLTNVANTGRFVFDGLFGDIEYKVELEAPQSHIASFNILGTPVVSGSDSLVMANEVMSQTFTLPSNNTVFENSRFGWQNRSGVAGRIFLDSNDNGEYEPTLDLPIASSSVPVAVTLEYLDGSLPQIVRTFTNGTNYQVTGLQQGKWRVTLSGIVGATNYRASFDADDPHNSASLPESAETAIVTIEEGQITQADFGYIAGGLLSGVVKEDSNPDGYLINTQAGIAGVDVALLSSSGIPEVIAGTTNAITAKTDKKGIFTFRNLDISKDYKLQVRYTQDDEENALMDMYPTFDSSYTHLEVVPTSAGIELPWAGTGVTAPSTVDPIQQLHTIEANVSQASAQNYELTPDDLYWGYMTPFSDLVIQKVALKDRVKVGELVPYRIMIINNSNVFNRGIAIHDLIPPGFAFVNGSARLDGKKEVIVEQKGRTIVFSDIDLGAQNSHGSIGNIRVLNYFLAVGAGVTEGEYVNTAVAKTRAGKISSAESQATVTVAPDPLFDDSLIFGTVYVDSNRNGVQDDNERGLGGVKLITARGEIITTDKAGRYHLVDVSGGRWGRGTNFILKLDPKSLPSQYRVISRNPVIVRLSPGLPSKVDFRVIKIGVRDEN